MNSLFIGPIKSEGHSASVWWWWGGGGGVRLKRQESFAFTNLEDQPELLTAVMLGGEIAIDLAET